MTNCSIKLKCGCEIPIVNNKLHINYDKLNDDCKRTWKLYSEGYTRSIFQLESRICQTWCKELKTSSIKDAADLSAIIRPGVSNSKNDDGTSMTKVFCNRKNELDIYDKNSIMGKLLLNTYGIMIYQEDLMRVSKELAGFDGKMSNKLVKGVGKKDAELLFSLQSAFIDGCIKKGVVSKEEAIEIFEQIKASARYLFGKCICPSTMVETTEGAKSIDELNIGEFINSPDGFIEVLDKFETGEKDLYEIELESGEMIKCTLYHKFLCDDGNIYTLYHIRRNDLNIVTKVNNF